MYGKEKYNLEFKESLSRTFLKTVSAFANYNDGQIVIGVNDAGEVVGLGKPEETILRIENMINDALDPVPNYQLEISDIDDKKIIILHVFKGEYTPYYSRNKAYRRSDTATLEVDRSELKRLVMEGINLDYEEQTAGVQELNFKVLEEKLVEIMGVGHLDLDILKTLKLYNKEGFYTIAGELFADNHQVEFSGIDIVRFGEDINQILSRDVLSQRSLLLQYDQAIELFERYYQYEEIEGYKRVKKERIPKEAFREALANAIVHRDWSIRGYIQISMYENEIKISSPGGLTQGISEEDYLSGTVSILRNPIIADVFNRLNLIEKFGTGIKRIKNEYADSMVKPDFRIASNNLQIILPVIDNNRLKLESEELVIYELLQNGELPRAVLDEKTGFAKSKTLRHLNQLIESNIVEKLGSGPGTTYGLKE